MREGRLGYNCENGRYGLLSMDLWIDTGFHCGECILKGSPTNVFKSFTPPQKGAGTMLQGDDVAAQLAGILAKKHLI